MMDKAVIFDLDGTLLDTLEDLADSVNEMLRAFSCPERSLEEIRLPDSLSEIGVSAFFGCALKEITVPEKVTVIENDTFGSCERLEKIELHDGITSIGEEAFNACESLAEIKLPASLTKLGASAFSECEALKEISIPDGVTEIAEYTFERCRSLERVELPEDLLSIGDYAFYFCDKLVTANIPKGVTSIGNNAFELCVWLNVIVLPKSVTTFGDEVFKYADSIGHVYYGGSEEDMRENLYNTGNHGLYAEVWHYNTSYEDVVRYGDLDRDTQFTVADSLAILRVAARIAQPDEGDIIISDIDGDGEITVSDALAILRIAAKMSRPLW